MSKDITPTLWLQQLDNSATREEAAERIVTTYVNQLLAFIRSKLSKRFRSRIDENDILQNVWNSFFRCQFDIRDRNSLFALLAAMCVRKTQSAVRQHSAARRNTGKESLVPPDEHSARRRVRSADSTGKAVPNPDVKSDVASFAVDSDVLADRHTLELMAYGATGDQAAIAIDLIEQLKPGLQEILCWRLEGHTDEEIAAKLGRTRRTVVRRFGLIRDHFQSINPAAD